MGDRRGVKGVCAWVAIVVAALSLAAVTAAPASAADRAYTKRFGIGDTGDIRMVGNTSMSCVTSVTCTAARAGTGLAANWNNDAWNMAYVDVDSDATTFSSSRATLDLPAGATVLFAGLYWGGDAPAAAARDQVKFDTPAPGAYQDLVATTLDTSTTTPTAYQGFRDVTGLVAAVGAGDYWVANVQGTPGATGEHAGWALVVTYRDAASPRQNLAVFDGFQDVKVADPHSATLTGLTPPASGTIDATIGLFAHEGDLGITGDVLAVNATTLSDALNPANNAFNSSITRRGVRLSAKNPDYVNQFSVEMDTFAADGIVPLGANSITVNMTSTQDRYYPGVITYAVEAEMVPPVTTIDSGPSGYTNDSTPTYAFSSNEAGSTFECRVDGAAWTSCTSPTTTAALADGSHTFEVRAIDVAGNIDPTPEIRTITVDTVAPQTTIDSGPSGPTNDSTPTFAFSSSQVGSTFECRVDAGAWASCSSAHTTASLADGAHTFEVRAIDPASNVDATPASRSFTVDTTAPQTTIDSGPSGPTNDSTPTFAFSADQVGSTFECRVDGGAWASCSSAHTTASLADGAHTFEVRATDPVGNVDATPASRSFTVDTAAPQTTIDSGPSGPTNDSTPTFAFSSSQAGSSFECRVDAGAWASCSSAHTTASLADGAHTFEVRATDAAGNVDATPASRSFTVDTAAPDTTIDSGPSGPTNDATPTFAFSSSQAGSSFECRVDGGAWGSCSTPETTGSLADGAHTFEVRATDPAGNVDPTPASRAFTVDTAAPQTTIDSGPSGPTSDSTPTFAFSSSQAGSSFECRVDGGAWGSCSTPETTASLADGGHTFEVRASDPAGNVDPTPASRSFTVDTAAPDTMIDSGPSGPTNDATPTFGFSADEAGSTFECRVDGGAWGPCSTPETTPSLTDGAHTFEVRATDLAGNVDPTPASRSFTVDTAAPQTTIDSGPSGPTSDATPTFAFSSDQPGSTFECRVDGGAWGACSTPETTASLTDGAHTFEVRATDPAGNVDPTPASRSFTVDTAAPNTTIDSGPSGPTNDATPTFAFSASQAGSSFECRVDGGAWGACSTPETTASLADGAHTFEVRATDAAGNVDATPASRSFTVDTAAPDTAIDSGPVGPTSDSTPTFGFSASQAGSSFECRVDGGAWGSCSTPETTASLADGGHTFEVRASDPAGNVDPTPAARSFTVDTAAPDTAIDSGPVGPTSDSTPTFAFSADEAGSTFECRVDGGAWGSCSTPETTASLTDGAHTFEVRATDPAGNVDPTPASWAFTVDTGAPQTTIDSGPSGATNDATPTFAFSADEADSTFECRVDGGAWGSCSTPETTGSLADGAHTFEVRATDPAGNVDATPASRSFTVDTAAPQTTIDSGPSGPTSDATPTFAFSADEAGSTFECRVDGGAWGSCSTPETTGSLADGAHTFEVRATDLAGNVDPTPASRSFTIDTAVPDTTIDSGPSGPTNDATPTFGFSADQPGSSFECRVDGGAWGSCATPETTTSLTDGAHTFEVRATDPAGNVDPTPASRAFTVDTAAPQTTIDSGPSGPTNDATPTYTFSANQPASTFECRIDGGAWVSCSSAHTTAPQADGAHTFEVRATDPAGNVDPTPASRSFTVDTGAPQTTIDSGPSGPTNDATPTFAFSADEAGSTFECRVDGGAWGSCSTPETTGSLADGAHTFEVRATDLAGNIDATPASRGFTVDTAAPQTTIDSGPSGPTSDSTPTFAFSASQPGSSFDCRVDGGAWGPCSTPETTTSLSDGAHTFEVRATDPAGNVDPTPASRSFTVDTAAPDTTINSGPSGPTSDTTPTFAFSSDQGGSSFECRVDGGAWGSCSTPETTASLTDVPHTFEVRATDPAGNVDPTPASRSFTVDTAAPQTAIDSGPFGATSDVTPTFTLSSDQAGSTFECRVDGGVWASCSPVHTTAALGDGPHTLEVRATDPAGNVDATPASWAFTVDTAAPQTTIDSGPSAPTSDVTPTFAFSADQAGSSFECRVDGGAWGSCSTPETTASLADGAHTFEVRATDPAGNVDATPASRTFTVDTAAPDTTIDSGPSGPTNDATPTFGFSADQPGSSFECRVDGGAWGSCSTPETTGSLTDGSHTFEVRATDPAGNVDPTPASRSFMVDTAAPQTTIDSGPSDPTADSTPTFAFSADQPGSTFECRIDGGAWASCSPPHTTAALGDGPHTFEVRTTDPAGNTDTTPAQHSFVVETGPPDTTIDSGPSGATNDPTPTFGFSASEAGSSFECRVDGGAWGSCSTPETTGSLADGAHTFEVRATDLASNVDPTPASRSFTVDTAAPDTTVDSGPSGPTNDATPTFAFSASQPGSTFECRVDAGAWASCSSSHTTAALSDGPHTFEVRTTDPAGNVDPTPASRSFTVDTTGPDTSIDSGPSGPTSDSTPTFAFSADQAGSSFECRVDGGAWGSCSTPDTAASLADGAHTFEVRATDPVGNVDPTPASRSFTVDTATPDSTIDSGPSGATNDATPTFTFSASQPGSTFECRIDGGAWASCSSPYTTATLGDGPHTFEVRTTDPAGNVDPTPASRHFTVHAAVPNGNPPPVTPNNPPPNITPSGEPPPPTSDLSALAGSLVGDRSCQRLGAGLRTKRLKVRGIGRVTVRIQASAIVLADAALQFSVTGPRSGKGRLRSVGYTLDGRRMRGSGRQPFTLAITPAALARVGRHALTLKLKPRRGRAGTVKLGMRTFPCKTVFRAYQKRTAGGSQLKLRIDARDAIAGATFSVPSKMLPKGKARLKVGTIRVVSTSGGSRSWSLAFGAKPAAQLSVAGVGAPSVILRGNQVIVGGLPAGSGIVEVILNTKRSTRPTALVSPRRSAGLRASVTGPSAQRLSYKLRGRR